MLKLCLGCAVCLSITDITDNIIVSIPCALMLTAGLHTAKCTDLLLIWRHPESHFEKDNPWTNE